MAMQHTDILNSRGLHTLWFTQSDSHTHTPSHATDIIRDLDSSCPPRRKPLCHLARKQLQRKKRPRRTRPRQTRSWQQPTKLQLTQSELGERLAKCFFDISPINHTLLPVRCPSLTRIFIPRPGVWKHKGVQINPPGRLRCLWCCLYWRCDQRRPILC